MDANRKLPHHRIHHLAIRRELRNISRFLDDLRRNRAEMRRLANGHQRRPGPSR
jgi:hypothetical protein